MAPSFRSRLARAVPFLRWREDLIASQKRKIQTLRSRLNALRIRSEQQEMEIGTLRSELAQRAKGLRDAEARIGTEIRKREKIEKPYERLRSQHLELDRFLRRPSFARLLKQRDLQVRYGGGVTLEPATALLQLPYKLRNMALAESHGVPVPTVFRVWPNLDEVRLAGLPDRFVLKADRGHSAQAVFPLEQTGSDRYGLIDGSREFSEAELLDVLRRLGKRAGPPIFAEEMLERPSGTAIPDDVKCYAFHGEIGQILVMNVQSLERRSLTSRRYLDPEGRDLENVALHAEHDSSVPLPHSLSDIARTARHLSLAVGLPFARIDLYDTNRGPVFGEITQTPGGEQRYQPDHDEGLANLWFEAEIRVETDLRDGRPVGTIWGPHPYRWLYPEGPFRPNAWERPALDCGRWCPSSDG